MNKRHFAYAIAMRKDLFLLENNKYSLQNLLKTFM